MKSAYLVQKQKDTVDDAAPLDVSTLREVKLDEFPKAAGVVVVNSLCISKSFHDGTVEKKKKSRVWVGFCRKWRITVEPQCAAKVIQYMLVQEQHYTADLYLSMESWSRQLVLFQWYKRAQMLKVNADDFSLKALRKLNLTNKLKKTCLHFWPSQKTFKIVVKGLV